MSGALLALSKKYFFTWLSLQMTDSNCTKSDHKIAEKRSSAMPVISIERL